MLTLGFLCVKHVIFHTIQRPKWTVNLVSAGRTRRASLYFWDTLWLKTIREPFLSMAGFLENVLYAKEMISWFLSFFSFKMTSDMRGNVYNAFVPLSEASWMILDDKSNFIFVNFRYFLFKSVISLQCFLIFYILADLDLRPEIKSLHDFWQEKKLALEKKSHIFFRKSTFH